MATQNNNAFEDRYILILVVLLGFSAVISQLTLMREMLSVFSGNELALGAILGNWLLLSGIGSALGRYSKHLRPSFSRLLFLMVLITIIPLFQIAGLRILRDYLFIRGALIGITETVLGSFIFLAPFCVVSGFCLTYGCALLSKDYPIGKVYFADSLGSIFGGITFSFVLGYLFDHFLLLAIVAILNCVVIIFLSVRSKAYKWVWNVAVLAVILIFLSVCFDVDLILTRFQTYGQKVLFHGNSPYGRIVVTELDGQLNFIENGLPLSPSHNRQQVEETVHLAMAQRTNAERVLLIGGGYTGSAKEILKYGVSRVTYVELDPLIIRLAGKYLPEKLSDPRINIVNTDGRRYIRESKEKYDIVIIDLPDPSTSQLNRFFTVEFLWEVKRIMKPNGVLAFGISHYENFVTEELSRILSIVNFTLKSCFKNTLILPCLRVYFLASDGELTTDIAQSIEKKNISTQYVKRSYLNAMLTPDRLSDVAEAGNRFNKINSDFTPSLYFYNILHWISQFRVKFGVLQAILLLFFIVYVIRLTSVQFAVFSAGFSGLSLEIVLLLVFQALHGSLYHQVGILITLFMIGLTVGAGVANRALVKIVVYSDSLAKKWLVGILAMCLATIALILTPVLKIFADINLTLPVATQIGIYIFTFAIAFIAGMQFPVACAVESEEVSTVASRIYTADFVGSSAGGLLAGTLLIPLFGINAVCIICVILNLIAAGLIRFKK